MGLLHNVNINLKCITIYCNGILCIHHFLYIRNISLFKHQMITVVLLLRHSLICFLWRVVSFNSCIITEHQRNRNTVIRNCGKQTQAQSGNSYTCVFHAHHHHHLTFQHVLGAFAVLVRSGVAPRAHAEFALWRPRALHPKRLLWKWNWKKK